MIKKHDTNSQVVQIIKESGNPSVLSGNRYRMGIISDRHCGAVNGAANFQTCLNTLKAQNCQFIIEAGDMTYSGTEAEWQTYIQTIQNSQYSRSDIHECIGNHENVAGIDTAKARFKTYSNNGELASSENIYFYKDINGDRFIFTHLEAATYTGDGCFSSTQMDFVENAISSYSGTGYIWVLTHQHFQLKGPGDWPEAGFYAGGIKTGSDYPQNTRFYNILKSRQNVFHVHGHSHFSLRYYAQNCAYAVAQGINGKLCAFSRYGDSGSGTRRSGAIGIHSPSGTRLRYADNDSSAPTTEHTNTSDSECIVADVFQNGVRLTGLDYAGNEICVHEIVFNGDKEVQKIYQIIDGQQVEVWSWS